MSVHSVPGGGDHLHETARKAGIPGGMDHDDSVNQRHEASKLRAEAGMTRKRYGRWKTRHLIKHLILSNPAPIAASRRTGGSPILPTSFAYVTIFCAQLKSSQR